MLKRPELPDGLQARVFKGKMRETAQGVLVHSSLLGWRGHRVLSQKSIVIVTMGRARRSEGYVFLIVL